MVDRITPEQRSRLMSKIKSKDTGIEKKIRSSLHKLGLRFRLHVKSLPGKPDIVFTRSKIAIFINGDFWHGYRYRQWRPKLSFFWRNKIETNMARDKKNYKVLRKAGWRVINIWEHQIQKELPRIVNNLVKAIKTY